MINNVILGKKINDLSLDIIKKGIEESGEPTSLTKGRLEYLEQAMNLKLPSKPDEAWRRMNLVDVELKDYFIAQPNIEISYLCKDKNKNEDLCVKTIEDTMKENPERFDKFYNKLEQIKSIAEVNKDTVYTSDMDNTVFLALSESLFNSGIFVFVPKFTTLSDPVKITITTDQDNSLIIPQIFLFMEEGSSADVVIEHRSKGTEKALSLSMIKGILEDGSRLNVLNYQDLGVNTLAFQNRYFTICKDALLSYDFIQTGSRKSMTQHHHALTGKGAEVCINGIVRASEDQFIGNKLGIHHYSPKTFSDFKSKSVLRDKSEVVFLGNIKMPAIAQKCNGYQSANNLILGEESKAKVIPRLEIIADDVKCSHGATVGSIDKEQLFYLTSRGINPKDAENLIIKSYYQDTLNNMAILRKHCCAYEYITERLSEKLNLKFDSFSPRKKEKWGIDYE